jgi:peptidyl-prolyl cis-trans isomerase D
MKKQRVGRTFAEIAENFNNMVFEQSESLKPAAELAKATAQQSGWLTRERAAEERLNNPRLLQAIFSEDVLNKRAQHRGSGGCAGHLVAARLVEHKPFGSAAL